MAASDDTNRFRVATTEPNSISASEGATIELRCKMNQSIHTCRFYLPGITDEIKLNPSLWKTIEGYSFVGKGLNEGECGLKVYNVTKRLNGIATCKLDPNDGKPDAIGYINITINDRSNDPATTIDSFKLPVNHSRLIAEEKIPSNLEIDNTSNAESLGDPTIATEDSVNVTNASSIEQFANVIDVSTTEQFVALTNPSTPEESATVGSTLSASTIEKLVNNQTQRSVDRELATDSGEQALTTETSKGDNSTDDGK